MAVIQLVAGPQHSAGDEFEVARVGDRRRVVAQRRAEHSGLAVLVDPRHDIVVDFLAGVLNAAGERLGGVEHPQVVVQLFVDRRPIPQGPRDRVFAIDIFHVDRLLRSVGHGMQSKELEPVVVAQPVAVHRAVEVDGGNPFAVRVEDSLDVGAFLHVGRAFVVNDDIVTGRPILFFVAGEAGFGGTIGGIADVHDDMGPRFEARFEHILLLFIVVAATAGDQQRFERLGRFGRGGSAGRSGSGSQTQGGRHSGHESERGKAGERQRRGDRARASDQSLAGGTPTQTQGSGRRHDGGAPEGGKANGKRGDAGSRITAGNGKIDGSRFRGLVVILRPAEAASALWMAASAPTSFS